MRAVVLDLRANGGGDLDTAMAVLGWLLGPEPVHISDVVCARRIRCWESLPHDGLAPAPGGGADRRRAPTPRARRWPTTSRPSASAG